MLAGLLGVCLSARAPASDDSLPSKISKAVDGGVRYLRSLQSKNGIWEYRGNEIGMTALAGWTLLEARVPAQDPSLQKAAKELRKRCVELTSTYGLSLAIIFFDRLADPRDRPLIQAIGIRLLAGQNQFGGWSYECAITAEAAKTLALHLQEAGKAQEPGKRLPEDLSNLIDGISRQPKAAEFGDNSNTQFAMLALWVARRHGLPVDTALALVDERFRRTQFPQGSWGYNRVLYMPRATMTCAGLLGLALGQGVKIKAGEKAQDIRADAKAKMALRALEQFMQTSPIDGLRCYLLFSLERMAVIYNLKVVGKLDWFEWGARELLGRQRADGSWPGDHGPADTCFALLFLSRANVAQDLTLDLNPLLKTEK